MSNIIETIHKRENGNSIIHTHNIKEIEEGKYMDKMLEKELRFRESLQHKNIKEIRGKGLILAAILPDDRFTAEIVDECRKRGVIFFLLLFEKRAIRITPPYTITTSEIDHACKILHEVIEVFYKN